MNDADRGVRPKKKEYVTKKCPYCGSYVRFDAARCDGCQRTTASLPCR